MYFFQSFYTWATVSLYFFSNSESPFLRGRVWNSPIEALMEKMAHLYRAASAITTIATNWTSIMLY